MFNSFLALSNIFTNNIDNSDNRLIQRNKEIKKEYQKTYNYPRKKKKQIRKKLIKEFSINKALINWGNEFKFNL